MLTWPCHCSHADESSSPLHSRCMPVLPTMSQSDADMCSITVLICSKVQAMLVWKADWLPVCCAPGVACGFILHEYASRLVVPAAVVILKMFAGQILHGAGASPGPPTAAHGGSSSRQQPHAYPHASSAAASHPSPAPTAHSSHQSGTRQSASPFPFSQPHRLFHAFEPIVTTPCCLWLDGMGSRLPHD